MAGRRLASEDSDEEDFALVYTYRGQALKVRGGAGERARTAAGARRETRTYSALPSYNNETRRGTASLDFGPPKGETQWGLDLAGTVKTFENARHSGYRRLSAAPSFSRRRGEGRWALRAGINSYDYEGGTAGDETSLFAKAEAARTFWNEALRLDTALRAEQARRERADRAKRRLEWMGLADAKPRRAWLDRASLRLNLGQKDSRVGEERDIDYDYRIWNARTSTYHEMGEASEAVLTLEGGRKRFLGSYPGHRLRRARGLAKRTLLKEGPFRWWASLAGEYKAVDFETPGDGYRRRGLALETLYGRREAWKAALTLEGRLYNYKEGRRRRRLYAGGEAEKTALGGRLSLGLALSWRLAGSDDTSDEEEENVKTSLGWSF